MSERIAREKEILNFEPIIAGKHAVEDYIALVHEKMSLDEVVNDEVIKELFDKIGTAARNHIWKILFEDDSDDKEQLLIASRLLREYRSDACFYNPWDYNTWIVTVRDELLKRNMINFWKDEIVKNELGTIWARDSDLFEYGDDPEPAEFYNHAGATAPSNMRKEEHSPTEPLNLLNESLNNTTSPPPVTASFKKISLETPLEDYRHNMNIQDAINSDDNDARNKIFKEGQGVVWQLLFNETPLTRENYTKAANLLKSIKEDSCLYNPYIYNEWIVTLRNELVNRKYNDFWNNVIVDQKMGLCCFYDSEFFSDPEDEKPGEFYKSYEKIMSEK